MSTIEESGEDQWSRVWDAREAALKPILGEPGDSVFHSTIPFEFRDAGGSADVVSFPSYVAGATYVTAELTGLDAGRLQSSLGNYELMICARSELEEAASFIARLACYTCDAVLEPGQTMDVGDFFGDRSLRAMLFTHPSEAPTHFEFLGHRYSLLLCVGITPQELEFAHSHGSEELLRLLKSHGVFPCTVPGRASVTSSGKRSVLSRVFGRTRER